jgi:hypothetical protein
MSGHRALSDSTPHLHLADFEPFVYNVIACTAREENGLSAWSVNRDEMFSCVFGGAFRLPKIFSVLINKDKNNPFSNPIKAQKVTVYDPRRLETFKRQIVLENYVTTQRQLQKQVLPKSCIGLCGETFHLVFGDTQVRGLPCRIHSFFTIE